MANHGIVRQIEKVLAITGKPMSPRQLAALVRRPRYWSHATLYRNIASLLPQYARRGKWRKLERGWYITNGARN